MFNCVNLSEKNAATIFVLLAFWSFIFVHVCNLVAQTGSGMTYQVPPKAVADLVDAAPTPAVSIDPTHQWMLMRQRPSQISIDELSQPELRLAGRRINPATHGPSRGYYYTWLKLLRIKDKKEFDIAGIPADAKIRNLRWSPDGKYIAFLNSRSDGQDLWLIEIAKKSATKLGSNISSVYGAPFTWLPDNRTLVCKVTPAEAGPAPVRSVVPTGPVVQESSGKKAAARTYQDLLKNPFDEMLFSYHFTVQLVKISVDGKQSNIGSPGIIRRVSPAPNGNFLLVESVHKPFSYLVPSYRFPYKVEVWNLDGKVVKEIADLPLAEEVPIGRGAVPTGPRNFDWRSDAPATLTWVEAQDGGNPRAKAAVRDKIFTLAAPFDGQPLPLVTLNLRFNEIQWGTDNLALVSEWWWASRKIQTWRIKPADPASGKTLLFDYSWQDRYNVPGSPEMKTLPNGHEVLLTDAGAKHIFLSGAGASPEGDRPFLDSFNLAKKETKRLWRSENPYYEYPVIVLDKDKLRMITRRETITEAPNYFLRDLQRGKMTQLTEFSHPTPQLRHVKKELIRYDREDGVKMTATLYLPPGYKKSDGPLPMLMWAYPREFKSAKAAGQVTGSPYRFVRVSAHSPLVWLMAGYAVLDGPTMPIIGEGDKEPNDTYVEQLVASAKAAVDEVVRRGIADRNRIAIGGHSYGAFMTANLLAHSDLFAAGIARSGAYNRTLTPFGFQAEERTYWEAPEVYYKMSPFMHSNKVNEPILLIHGEADNNSGTFPIQSKRFYNALKGHGGTARLVMLPNESHGYRARESIMHMLWETNNWLEKYVKNRQVAN